MNVAAITGASSGIGLELSKLMLKRGWKVYGLSRRRPDINHDLLSWVECDLSKPETIAPATSAITEKSIDVLFSNAGVAHEETSSTDINIDGYKAMYDVNVLAPMLLVSSLKRKVENATIFTVSSVADRLISDSMALYCSSKAANTRYFEAVAQGLPNAHVYGLLPDYVDTPMLREAMATNPNFDWGATISPADIAHLTLDLIDGKHVAPSGANIIIVTDALKDDLMSREQLYSYNTDSQKLEKL